MSGLEIVGTVVALLQLAGATYNVIKGYKDLPGEFKAVGERLPVAQKTLETIKAQAETAQIDNDTVSTIQPLLEGCQTKVEELQKVFDIVRKWKGEPIRAKYAQFLGAVTGKGKRVEALMEAILKDVQMVAADRTFKTATAAQMDGLKKAIEDLAALQPDEPEGSGGNQNIGKMTGGKVFFNQSGTIQAPDGHYFGSITGGVHFGTDIYPKKPKSSEDDDFYD
ncbi:hypothetical protein MAPG_03560 [Magnaporthiopsis poae ATCC 64411]|uniref:NACHT-NTPase and P-loop NTPases N-terminal domain-containing protein n=1 Tax=Magnaporthiopsis poae (strain ATCC 64411 / 73-15) TaxID=644358 RepID=A0A0C4DUC2_MAGP6|nr:hypothetical protein MAPG_03560 [Magnaporthiopsis poae ATCC 64411]